MRAIAGYISDYFRQINWLRFFVISLVLSALIAFNYHYFLNKSILALPSVGQQIGAYYLLFASTLLFAWLINNFRPGAEAMDRKL